MPETLKRIDPATVPGLFRSLDIRPVRNDWGGGNCGCVLVALVGAAKGRGEALAFAGRHDLNPTGQGVEEAANLTGYGPDYLDGLMDGWDGRERLDRRGIYTDGYDDGRAAAVACGLLPDPGTVGG